MGGSGSKYEYYQTTDSVTLPRKCWMEDVEGTARISELSVPGTIRSASLQNGHMGQYQSWTISQQLEAGIRFLDLHCCVTEEQLQLYNYSYYQGFTFNEAVDEIEHFLKENPTETVLIRLVEDEGKLDEFYHLIRAVFQKPIFWQNKNARNLPRLDQIRGRIVMVLDLPLRGILTGLNMNTVDEQTEENLGTIGQSWEHWLNCKTHLERAVDGTRDKLYLTYLHGCSPGAYPYSLAYRINCHLYQYPINLLHGGVGIVAMAFPGEELIRHIISNNPPKNVSSPVQAIAH